MTDMVNVRINGKWDLKLPKHRADRPEWTSEQGWERARLDSLFNYITDFKFNTKHKPVIYYVGAEEGDMCALCQIWGARVYLFEPNPKVWPNIKAIWESNLLKSPEFCFAGFVGNETSEDLEKTDPIAVNQFPECANNEVIGDHGVKNLCEADGTIPIVKIDDLVGNNIVVPDIISIDVEGAEWEVLRGAENILKMYHPTIYLSLHPEFLYEIYKEYSADLRHWLKEIGYKETLLDYQHEVHLVYEGIK